MSSTTVSSPPVSGGRLAVVIAGALIGLFATLLLMAGGAVHWADGKKDDDGYFSTRSERFATTTYAIASDDLDVNGIPLGEDHYGKVRVKVGDRGGKPVFAGIARSRDVDAYLASSAHATLTDLDFSPFKADYRTSGGQRRPAPPAAQDIWVASAQGPGTQTLDWTVKDGSWSVVVMNADGSAGVDAGVSAGVSVPFLDDVELWLWIAAAALLALAGAMIAAGLRLRRQPSSPDGSAWAA
jgi:hypothetical protein